jgi:phosphoribosylaminoimidazole (AIR) synthetase
VEKALSILTEQGEDAYVIGKIIKNQEKIIIK